MKELSIEEKAKAYDRAIEKLRNFCRDYDTVSRLIDVKEELANLIPELKESKDERIRKRIIALVNAHGQGMYKDEMLVWLEKQGDNPTPINIDKMVMEYSQTKDGDFGLPVNCMIRAYRKGIIDVLNLLSGIEKQDSQILANSTKTCEDEQKPADKVEPKFHEGQWVVDKEGHISQITRIDRDFSNITYACRLIENPISLSLYFENEIRLWDITKDAKTGDVLIDDIGVILFRKIGNEKYENAVDYHCVVYTDGKFEKQEGLSYWGLSTYAVLHPATKVQRERFFARMHEAGYEWDAERLELKKVDNEIEIPFGAKDSELQEVTYFIPKGFHAEINEDNVVIKKGEKPTAWSEEDERILRTIISDGIRGAELDMLQINWLKALKDRVTPQPKQEWSVEDEDMLDNIIDDYDDADEHNLVDDIGKVMWLKSLKDRVGCEASCTTTKHWSREDEVMLKVFDSIIRYIVEVVDKDVFERFGTNSEELFSWIKSIKDRYTWKPSSIQMECLHDAIEHYHTNGYPATKLTELYEQLSKIYKL